MCNERADLRGEYFNSVDLCGFFGVDQLGARKIREAFRADWVDYRRRYSHLAMAFIGYPTSKFLEKYRLHFAAAGVWPGDWGEEEFQSEEPGIPVEHHEVYQECMRLPDWVFELAHSWRPTLTQEQHRLLKKEGLIEYWKDCEVFEFLATRSITEIRAICNKLGSGKARSKEELIGKLMTHATGGQVLQEVESQVGGAIKTIRTPLDRLPYDWVRYQQRKALMMVSYFNRKEFAYRLLDLNGPRRVISHPACAMVCDSINAKIGYATARRFATYPPWYPGCLCDQFETRSN